MKAEVTLVHVMTDPAYYAMNYSPIMGYRGGYTNGTLAIVNDLKIEAWKFLTAAVKHLGDDKIKPKILTGETADAILEYSQSRKVDLIVMGSHNHKGLERLFVIDVATYIQKHSKIPLLTIPTDA